MEHICLDMFKALDKKFDLKLPTESTVPTTNPDNMGPLRCSCHENSRFWSSCSTASESFARQRWTCVLVFSKFNLTSWVLAKQRLHMVNKNILPRTSCPTFFPVDDVSTYAGLLYVLSRDCWEGLVFVQAFWVCLKIDYVLPATWQFIRKWWDNDEKPDHWKIDGLAYFQTNPF